MLLESLAAELDTASATLSRDNDDLHALLSHAAEALRSVPDRNETISRAVTEIEEQLRADAPTALVLSDLASRNDSLRAALEHVLVAVEDLTGRPGYQMVDEVRSKMYKHLREVAVRGWSFWDVSSFREKMAAVRTSASS